MQSSRILALSGAVGALALTPAVALAGGPATVSVRVEGKTHTLLASTDIRAHTGSITKGGTPAGVCAARTAAGALDVATHRRWAGKYYSSVAGIFITSIFGEMPTGSDYWTVFVDNRSSTHGICQVKLHRGEQLLFAVTDGSQSPIVLTGPKHATSGHSFKVKVTYYNGKGVAKPVAHARVVAGSVKKTTGAGGTASFTATHPGVLKLRASRRGYVRSATLSVRIAN